MCFNESDCPEAETKCQEFMDRALMIDAENPEVYQTCASVRLSQCKPEDAKLLLCKSMDLWYKETEEPMPDESWPVYASRMTLCRLLIECELYDRALKALQTCQAENDEDPQCWYLFGWCYYQMSLEDEEYRPDAIECLNALVEVL